MGLKYSVSHVVNRLLSSRFCCSIPRAQVGWIWASHAGDAGSIPGSGKSPGGGNGNPFQYSCLDSPMDRGAWQAIVHRVAESDMTQHTADST